MSDKVNAFVLIGLGIGLLAGGANLFAREIAPFDFAYGTRSDVIARLTQSPPPIAPSIYGTRLSMDICTTPLRSQLLQRSPEAQRAAVARNCAIAASEVVAAMPSHTQAYYVLALALFAADETEQAVEALAQSQYVGPNEQWIAERRVVLAERHYDTLGPYGWQGHLADLALLAQSRRGIGTIAERYLSNPDFRERVTAVVETLPTSAQIRFVSTVRNSARAQGADL